MYKVHGSDQKVYGPVSIDQLRQWMAEGRVHPSTLIQAEGATSWAPVSSLPEFMVPPVVNMPPPPDRSDNNNMALGGLLCGVLANLCCCGGTFFGVLGLVLSISVLSRRADFPGESNRQLAWAGLILCSLGLLWRCLLPLFWFVPSAWGFRHFHGWHLR